MKSNKKLLRGVQGEKKEAEASKPVLYTNYYALYDFQHFAAFTTDSIHSKKPSGGPKGLIGSPCHGAIRCRSSTCLGPG